MFQPDMFRGIYDQEYPVGTSFDKNHYSIVECLCWLDVFGEPLPTVRAHIQRIAVIWNNRRNERSEAVFSHVLTNALMRGILAPVMLMALGEGKLYVVTPDHCPLPTKNKYVDQWRAVVRGELDVVFVKVGDAAGSTMLSGPVPDNARAEKVETDRIFLQNIANLWAFRGVEF